MLDKIAEWSIKGLIVFGIVFWIGLGIVGLGSFLNMF